MHSTVQVVLFHCLMSLSCLVNFVTIGHAQVHFLLLRIWGAVQGRMQTALHLLSSHSHSGGGVSCGKHSHLQVLLLKILPVTQLWGTQQMHNSVFKKNAPALLQFVLLGHSQRHFLAFHTLGILQTCGRHFCDCAGN